MIDDGEPIGHVLEELAFMEMEICDEEVLENMGISLADFLVELNKGPKKNWRDGNYLMNREEERGDSSSSSSNGAADEVPDAAAAGPSYKNWREEDRGDSGNRNRSNSAAAGPDSHSYEVQLLNSENHVSVDLSAKTAADKKNQELESLFGTGKRSSLKDRMSMYNERGELRSDVIKMQREQLDGLENELEEDLARGKSIDELRRQELMTVMNDRSLTKNERAKNMDEVRAKYGVAEAKQAARRVTKIAQKAAQKDTASDHHNRHDQYNAYCSHQSINGSDGGADDIVSLSVGGVDLSAKAAVAKHAKEMASLFGGPGKGGSLKDRMAMYNEKGEIIKNTNQDNSEEDMNNIPEEKTVDQLRRDELMKVMKDRSLSKEEKARKMEEVRQKYSTGDTKSATSTPVTPSPRPNHFRRDSSASTSNGSIVSNNERSRPDSPPAPPPIGGVDLSAKAAADKNKREMESLFGNRGGGKMSSNRESYERQLLLDTPAKKTVDVYSEVTHNSNDANKNKLNNVNSPQPPSLDIQRRAELQSIMRDSSLKKDERRLKMEKIKEKYAAIAKEQENGGGGGGTRMMNSSDAASSSSSSSPVQNVERGVGAHVSIDLSAKSYAERSGKELKSIAIKSLSERKSMYSNNSTIVAGSGQQQEQEHKARRTLGWHTKHRKKVGVKVDPTSFALAENGLYGVNRDKKKSTSHEYGGRF